MANIIQNFESEESFFAPLAVHCVPRTVLYCSVLIFLFEVEAWLSEVDFNGDGILSYEEFKMCFADNLNLSF